MEVTNNEKVKAKKRIGVKVLSISILVLDNDIYIYLFIIFIRTLNSKYTICNYDHNVGFQNQQGIISWTLNLFS